MDTVRARMKDDLINKFRAFFSGPMERIDDDPEWVAFIQGIEGKEVTLRFTHGDAFEEQDNNFWLPDCMWDRIEETPP